MKRRIVACFTCTAFICCIIAGCSSRPQHTSFVYRISSNPVSLDPAHATDAAALTVIQELYDGLVELSPASGEIRPCIAERWEVTPDSRVWTFHIKRGVTFHNGRAVLAEDFRYSFTRALNPVTRCERTWVLDPIAGAQEYMAGKAAALAGIQVPDSFTLVITLAKPYAPFLSQLAMEIASVVPAEEVERAGERFGQLPCGAGPYRLTRFMPDVEITLSAFEGYHGAKAGMPTVRYAIIPNDIVAYEQYKSGEIDFLNAIPSGQLSSARRLFGSQFHQCPILELRYLGMNLDREPFKSHARLRSALSLALDRAGIARVIYEGNVRPACRVVPPGIAGSVADTACVGRNVDSAKALLAAEGFPGGVGLPELTLLYNSKEIETRLWQYVKANLEEAGFRIRLKSLEWGSFLDAVRKGEAELFRGSWVADYPDPHNFLFILFHSGNAGAAGNYSRFRNTAYDRLVEQASVLPGMPERAALYEKAEQIIAQQRPVCPLFYGGDAVLLQEKYTGFVPSVQGVWAVPVSLIKNVK